jgi:hypothetical protein
LKVFTTAGSTFDKLFEGEVNAGQAAIGASARILKPDEGVEPVAE